VLGDLRQVGRPQMGRPSVVPGLMRKDPGVVHPLLQGREIGHGASSCGHRPGIGHARARWYCTCAALREDLEEKREMIILNI
jgi:hypothetical protein